MIVPILYTVAGLSLGLAALELAARTWIRRRDDWFVYQPHMRQKFFIDRETLPSLEEVVRIEVNADGERGDAPPKPGEDVYRVLVAGGSAAECYLLDQKSAWSAVVQEELNGRNPRENLGAERAHVGNVARSLVPCEMIDRMLGKCLKRFRDLDLIVLMVGASDMVAWLERKTPDTLVAGETDLREICQEAPPESIGWKPRETAIFHFVRRWKQAAFKPVQVKHKVGGSIARNRAMRAAAKTIVDTVPDPRPLEEFFEKGLRGLIATCKAHAKNVLVVRQPWFGRELTPEEHRLTWNFGQGRPYLEKIDTYYSIRVVAELMAKVDASASRVAEDCGVWQLDLMPDLERSFETYYDYLHFTPKGSRRVGQLVAQSILDHVRAAAAEPSSASKHGAHVHFDVA